MPESTETVQPCSACTFNNVLGASSCAVCGADLSYTSAAALASKSAARRVQTRSALGAAHDASTINRFSALSPSSEPENPWHWGEIEIDPF